MRFLMLMPGTGHFYCGSCLRDDWLARALRDLGHDTVVAPLYLPMMLEKPGTDEEVHMGGVNVYLQQKARLARHLPGWVSRLLDRPGFLRWVSRRGDMTSPRDLGAIAISILEGVDGRQAKEVEKLGEWARTIEEPDVIVISNVMLSGVGRQIGAELKRPVICTLQGEAPFLDALPQPYRDRAWEVLRKNVKDIDLLVPVSRYYGDLMQEKLGVAPERLAVVHNGIDLEDMREEPVPIAQRAPPTIGFLAQMSRDKGLHTLVDAFLILKERDRIKDLRLRVAGTQLKPDLPLVRELQQRVDERGCGADIEFLPNIERAEKLAFLQTLSVLSVPATYGESFGLYLLEAMASGVPVVQPGHGAFPEILEATGGGLLCEPDDPSSLAEKLEELLVDGDRSQALADCGRTSVLENFTATSMAHRFEEVCRMALEPSSPE